MVAHIVLPSLRGLSLTGRIPQPLTLNIATKPPGHNLHLHPNRPMKLSRCPQYMAYTGKHTHPHPHTGTEQIQAIKQLMVCSGVVYDKCCSAVQDTGRLCWCCGFSGSVIRSHNNARSYATQCCYSQDARGKKTKKKTSPSPSGLFLWPGNRGQQTDWAPSTNIKTRFMRAGRGDDIRQL